MPKYRYIVINPENRQLQGTIGAPDETTARRELNELGFSVISMTQITEEEAAVPAGAEMPVFEFAALDKNRKRVVGTIQAPDRFSAYKRLIYEYTFEVEYVIDNNLGEEQKEKERKKGAEDLQDMLSEEAMLAQKKETGEEKDLKEFTKKQEILKSQIDFVLNKVREMLDLYEKDMKPETKEKIRRYVDKILRIRTSTNLDYIRKSAEELLTFLQKEELFLNEETHMKERTKLLVEAKSMTMQLRRSGTKTSVSFTDQLRQWRKEHMYEKAAPSLPEKIINILITPLIGAGKEADEIASIKRDIIAVNGQLKQYIRLYFQAPSPEFKAETGEGLKRLWGERKKLRLKLKEVRRQLTEKRRGAGEESALERFSRELLSFSGWLLALYLIYYFISIYAASKEVGLKEVPQIFYIFRSSFLKYFLATLFLFHGALSIKIHFFRRNEIATVVITPLFLLATLLILFNF